MKTIARVIRWIFWTSFVIGVIGAAVLGVYLYELSKTLPQNLEVELHKRNDILPTIIYDREGNQVDEFKIQRRTIIPYEQFPTHLIQALIASEDTRFFTHLGIDPMRIPIAFLANLHAGRIVQGASTLTQQTAREFLLSKEKQWVRKLREMLLAFRMEMQFTKQDIITLYLNKVYLGNAEGVEAAAQGYFGKHAYEMDLSESAMLVGVLPAPSRYAPHVNPHFARQRRNVVLHRMFDEHFITQQEMQQAKDKPIKLINIHDSSSEATSYYVEHVRRYLIKKYGSNKLYQGGLKVHLAMDLNFQTYAHEALRKGILEVTKRQGYHGPQSVTDEDNQTAEESTEEVQLLGDEELMLGDIIHGVVSNIQEQQAIIQFGDSAGVLEWDNVKSWRKSNPEVGKRPKQIHRISDLFSTDDIIQVRLVDYDSSKQLFRLELYQEPLVNGALLAMEPGTGQVLSMTGGYRYDKSEFNRAIQAQRQPGSAFKPIVYSAALDAGYTLSSMLVDSPRAYTTGAKTVGDAEIWIPRNYGNKLLGNVTLRTALIKSLNLPTIGLCEDLKPRRVISYSKKLGITSNMRNNLTTCLGSFSATLQEMVNAFGVFSNQGLMVQPTYILRVEDINGNILEQSQTDAKRVLSEETAFLMTSVLRGVVENGTGRRVRVIGRPSAGKTGTSNESVDTWYIGYIPQLLAGVYVGYDQPRAMGRYETGSGTAAPIWIDFMKNAITNLPTEQFRQPPGVTTIKIHSSGRRATPCDDPKDVYEEHYKTGTEPVLNMTQSGRCLDAGEAEMVNEEEEMETEL